MAEQPIGSYPELSVIVAPSREIGDQIVSMDWKSFVNGGYVVRARVHDPYLRLIRELTNQNSFLKTARQGPTEVKFHLNWRETPDRRTTPRRAFISDIHIYGTARDAGFEFVAIDPPSWWLNGGNGNGKVYRGNIKKVIEQVVGEYAPGVTCEVSETKDAPEGCWPMMRQDPKTFIQSLIDWSCSLTNKRTNWLVASVDEKIIIKEQNELLQNAENLANYQGSFMADKNEILDFDMLSNTFVTPIQNKLVTQGLSAVTGKFLDAETEKDKAEVRDDNTGDKVNAKVDGRRAYKKPDKDQWATAIASIPELSGGELGIKYEDYFDGRARNLYMGILPTIMRCKITVHGDFQFDDSSKLGVSTININWLDNDGVPFFLSGNWLVYGFHHRVVVGTGKGIEKGTMWKTDLYLYRIDHDANAVTG